MLPGWHPCQRTTATKGQERGHTNPYFGYDSRRRMTTVKCNRTLENEFKIVARTIPQNTLDQPHPMYVD